MRLFQMIVAAFMLATIAVSAHANPAPFGLEIGKLTPDQLKAKHDAQPVGINKYSQGPMYEISPAGLNFDGLREVTLIFGSDNRLQGVLTTLNKNRFDGILGMLRGKYQVVSQDIPFVGNKRVEMREGDTEITLDAPHLSFEMTMNYLHRDLVAAFERETAAEARRKKQSESSQL